MEYKYVITGDGMMAQVVHSDLNCIEFENLIRSQIRKIHPKCRDTRWYNGSIEFINPRIMSIQDFSNFCPALIGIK